MRRIRRKVNAYNIFSEDEPSCILYRALAESEDDVKELAKERGLSLEGLTIELDRENVKDMLGRPYEPSIQYALVY